MTLDVLHFIDSKGGNAEEIRESQRKRGHSVELVDEVIQMYADWVKRKSSEMSQDVASLAARSRIRGKQLGEGSEWRAEGDSSKEKGASPAFLSSQVWH